MASLNKVMLIGNVGADPEVRYLESSNAKVASLRMATTERYTDRSGENRENTEWHNIVAWRRLADTIESYVKKGTQIYVEGRLRTREWTDNSGAKRYTTEVVADNIQLLGRRSEGSAPAAAQGGSPYGAPSQAHASYGASAGAYSAPYQAPAPAAPQNAAPAVQSAPAASPAADAFTGEGDDDLPF